MAQAMPKMYNMGQEEEDEQNLDPLSPLFA